MSTFDLNAFLNQSADDAAAQAAALRESLANEGGGGFDNTFFPITKIDPGNAAQIRFLPANVPTITNPAQFWIVGKRIELKFLDPQDDTKTVRLNVPIAEMYETDKTFRCKTLAPTRKLYEQADQLEKAGKKEEMEAIKSIANKHWITYQYLAQGFVIKPGWTEPNPPTNPIRVFNLMKTIMKIMQTALKPGKDNDTSQLLPYVPTHPSLGTDFFIRKTQKAAPGGAQNSYETSGWARASSALTQEQVAAMREYGLHELTKFLPARPSAEEYDVLAELVSISIDAKAQAVWNPEWEAGLTTVKPFRVVRREDDFGDKDDFAGRVASAMEGNTTVSLANLKRPATVVEAPAAAAEAPAQPTVVETPAAPAAVETPVQTATTGGNAGAALAERLRVAMSKPQ